MSKIYLWVLGGLLLAAGPALAGGSSAKPSQEGKSDRQEQAVEAYNKGLEHRDKAWAYEAKAAAATKEKERKKNQQKAQKEYSKAEEKQRQATAKNPKFYQAFSSLGYALRQQGQNQQALVAYDQALKLEPDYAEAIEYRAEAYLGLDRVEEAQQAYDKLFLRDAKLAAQLLLAIGDWSAARRAAPSEKWDLAALGQIEQWLVQKRQRAEEMGGTEENTKKEW